MESILKTKRLEKNMTLEEVGNLVGVGKSTVRKWENGMIENMGRDKIVALSKALNISPLEILGMDENPTLESDISTIYNQLVPPRQEKVYNFAERQLEEQNRENVVHFPKKEKLPTIKNSASAANPTELVYGDTVVEEEEFERVPNNADFAVPIIGDSMEPVIRNGQFVFVKEQPDVEDGEIAIVEINGDGVTCKEVFKDYENQSIILRSINELYEDRVVSPEQIRIIGKVVF
ncbi:MULTISPECIES: XRE family transcriptional regulator [Enterococcus]|uniref:XRE family transcriptional regulator n=1 Tax=Enterococcus TaxID=1350 RepID=UPI00221EF95E|nr:S24 family peptidase [Enterococcus hirae]UYT95726.1 helix-turn-helix domain-containing protein [Enterococcus hirae]UYT97526.1 helix-turn-helix domain-containing protein [Enterococcus hirae]UYU00777.1 helix-turn-helix domain-containing protein [Enterococcus hirae]